MRDEWVKRNMQLINFVCRSDKMGDLGMMKVDRTDRDRKAGSVRNVIQAKTIDNWDRVAYITKEPYILCTFKHRLSRLMVHGRNVSKAYLNVIHVMYSI